MNRKLILLNLVLLVLAGLLFWRLRLKWVELHMHEHTVLALSPQVQARFAPKIPVLTPMRSAEYIDAVQHNIFAKDRNPNVIVDPPPPPPPAPPPPPMPALPSYFGTMAFFGDPVILLKLPKGAQKKYHAGDEVGPFKLVSFNREKVVFDWNGKTVERTPDDLKEKQAAPEEAASVPSPAPQAAQPPPSSRANVIGGATGDALKDSEKVGAQNGEVRMCVKGDTSPPGTVIDGYRKKILTNMFGETCLWEKVNP